MSAILKLAAVLALVVGLFLAEQHIEQRGADRQLLTDQAVANKLKAEAAQALATETAKTLANQTRLSDLIAKTETDRETQQIANRADLRRRSAGLPGFAAIRRFSWELQLWTLGGVLAWALSLR